MVYAEELDMILLKETWLNENVSDNEILPPGFNILKKIVQLINAAEGC